VSVLLFRLLFALTPLHGGPSERCSLLLYSIRCDPGASGQNAGSAEVDPTNSCAISIRWPSASACSLRVRTSQHGDNISALILFQQPTSKGSYSSGKWHWQFVVAFLGVCLAYFGGGYMYNYKVYGLSGREAFPHSQFWLVDLRGLVTDGCYYSFDLAKVIQFLHPSPPRHKFSITRCSQGLYARVHKCITGQDVSDNSEYAYSRAPTFEADVDQD
jgi:hypothetical protein